MLDFVANFRLELKFEFVLSLKCSYRSRVTVSVSLNSELACVCIKIHTKLAKGVRTVVLSLDYTIVHIC